MRLPLELDSAHGREFSGRWRATCLVLLLLATAGFLARGPIRAVQTATQFNDFLSPYIQAKALVHGLDPYSPRILLQLWPAQAPHFLFLPREVADGTLVAHRGFPTAYPVTAFVLVAPFSLFPWDVAYALWLGTLLALFVLMLCALVALSGFPLRHPHTILMTAFVLALAPFHTGVVTGNVTLVAVELSVIAIWAARRRSDIASAVMLAVAAGLKPQIGLCFLFCYLLRRRWRIFGVAIALLVCVAAAGLLRLEISHTPWLADYITDNRTLFETGVLGNFTAANPTRFGLINLQVALYPLLRSFDLTNVVARSIGAILFLAWTFAFARRGHEKDRELLDLSALAVISLLPIYHRFYDATLLALPVCWAFVSYKPVSKRQMRCFALLSFLSMLPFLIPGGTLLESLEMNGRIPSSLVNRAWWQAFVMAHQVWLLLFLSALLIYQMATNPNGHKS
jgi:hypothetical protein